MSLHGHPAPRWSGYEAVSAHEEQIYDIQNLIIAAEIREDEAALAGLRRCYVHIVTRGRQ